MHHITHGMVAAAMVLVVLGGCDSARTEEAPQLVIQGFLDSGKPLPRIEVRRTLSPSEPYDAQRAALSGAEVSVMLGSSTVRYEPIEGSPGVYGPVHAAEAGEGKRFKLHVRWNDTGAEAAGVVPPKVQIEKLEVRLPSKPVSAVLLDSLTLNDSLAVGARTGFIYPIEVSISWVPQAISDDFWVRAQLYPFTSFSSTVVDLFLRSDEILLEEDLAPGPDGLRTWTGVYAVGVEKEDDPLPVHKLRVALVRSGSDYARFASTRNAPERRAPVSNITGGVGIFTAISVDSTHLRVEQNAAISIVSPLNQATHTASPRQVTVYRVPADESATKALLLRLSKEGL